MFSEFILKKMRVARYRLLDDGKYFGEIQGCRGVWAYGQRLEECREELRTILEE